MSLVGGTGQPNIDFYGVQYQGNISASGFIVQLNNEGTGSLRIQTVGAGASNQVLAEGTLDGLNWTSLGVVVGSDLALIDTQSYEYIKLSCSVYGGTPFTLYWKGNPSVPPASLNLSGTGLATSVNQSTQIASLNEIEANTGSLVAVNPLITGVSLTSSASVYTHVLPINTVRFLIRIRSGEASFKMSFALGGIGSGSFLTVNRGCVFTEENLMLASTLTLYMQSNKDNQVAEILSWT